MGRKTTSLVNELRKAVPVVFTKDGNLTAAAFGGRWYNEGDTPLTVQRVAVSVGTAPTGASAIFDVKINGTTVYANSGDRPTITATNFKPSAKNVPTKTGAAIVLLPGQYLTVEATQVGSTVAGADPTVQVFLG